MGYYEKQLRFEATPFTKETTMSQTLKTRTFTDTLRTGLYKSIISTRKLSKQAVKQSKRAAKAANNACKEATSVAKQAWNADIS